MASCFTWRARATMTWGGKFSEACRRWREVEVQRSEGRGQESRGECPCSEHWTCVKPLVKAAALRACREQNEHAEEECAERDGRSQAGSWGLELRGEQLGGRLAALTIGVLQGWGAVE